MNSQRLRIACLIGVIASTLPYASTFIYKFHILSSPKVLLASSLTVGVLAGLCAYQVQIVKEDGKDPNSV